MATLHISVKKYLIGENYLRTGIVGNIYSLPDPDNKITDKRNKNHSNLIFPISDSSNRALSISVGIGRYLIKAYLPSGQIIDEEIFVETDNQNLDIVLSAETSPHEWLSWMQFAGYVERTIEEYNENSIIRTHFQASERTLRLVYILSTSLNDKTISIPDGLFFNIDRTNSDKTTDSPYKLKYQKKNLNDFRYSEILDPQDQDKISRYFIFDFDKISKVFKINNSSQVNYHKEKFQRFFLCLCEGKNIIKYSVLPSPWIGSDHSRELLVEALVRENILFKKSQQLFEIKYENRTDLFINVRDSLVTSIINYLGAGEIPLAKTVLEPAKEMLYSKLANPIAAAGGAYILLLTDKGTEKQSWYQWIENLNNWFPWLPDGAVQNAWLKLRMSKDSESLESIRDLVMDAYQRGLPFYSRGVSLLYDCLTILNNNFNQKDIIDKEINKALKAVLFLASRTNMRLPFTTVDLSY